jgi:hypothetical protein
MMAQLPASADRKRSAGYSAAFRNTYISNRRRRKLAAKVVDIFGNDTMTIVEVRVGGKS